MNCSLVSASYLACYSLFSVAGATFHISKQIFIYLFNGKNEQEREWESEIEIERERDWSSITGSLLKLSQKLGLGEAEIRSVELHLNLSCECRGPSIWLICCYFPRCISKEYDWKRGSWGFELLLIGIGLICPAPPKSEWELSPGLPHESF